MLYIIGERLLPVQDAAFAIIEHNWQKGMCWHKTISYEMRNFNT